MLSRSARTVAALALAALTLSSCLTGERPSFEDEGASEVETEAPGTGNDDIDLVLRRLDDADDATFSAGYEIETKFGSLSSSVTVDQRGADRHVVNVQRAGLNTEFSLDGADEQTCNVTTGECEDGLNDARISDVGIPHTFYGPSFATRLRVSADRRIGESNAYSEQIAGQDANCVDVTVAGGTETFCALASGVLARFVGNDVTIELTGYSPTPDL